VGIDISENKWFRRGWTLQELLAPASVDFFSREGELLGNKASLEQDICEITGIPATALRGSVLSDFSVAERIRGQRIAKRPIKKTRHIHC
jgi:hypothetical protein